MSAALNLEQIRRTLNELEAERDLNVFLSDGWATYQTLRDGGFILASEDMREKLGDMMGKSRVIYSAHLPSQTAYIMPKEFQHP